MLLLNPLGRLHCSPVRLRFCPVGNPKGGTPLCERPLEQSRQQQEDLRASSPRVGEHLEPVALWERQE